jgi:hypothetical protein
MATAQKQLFWYKGPSSNGEVWHNLTLEEWQNFEKQDKELLQKQQSDARLAPVINKQVSDYVKEKGIADQVTPYKESVPQSFRTATTDPISKAFGDIQANNEDTTELENVLTQATLQRPPVQSAAQTTQLPQQQGLSPDVEQVATQPKGTLASLMSDLPDEIIQPLLIQYNTGDIKPSELLKQIKEAKANLYEIKKGENKAKMESGLRVAEGAPKIASEEKIASGRDETDIKVAQINAAAQKAAQDARNAYSERTIMLKPPQVELITNYDNSLNAIDVINNMFDEKYIGVAKGRVGSVKQYLGLLGKEESIFRTAISEYQNELLKLRSGAAVTVPEYERFKKEVADVNSSPDQFKTVLARQRKYLENKKITTLKNWQKVGYNLGELEYGIGDIDTYEGGKNQPPSTVQRPSTDLDSFLKEVGVQ